jgi:hypothetical protein
MKFITAVFLFLTLCLCAKGQNQGNCWVFPNGNNLNFNTEPPTYLPEGAITCSGSAFCEGSASMADSAGNLLFYSDGTAVWGADHQVIANGGGLLGHPSSTNAAFIVPFPGSNSQYYLFTADGKENNLANGLRYNVVEVCGETEVSVLAKNVLLRNNVTEKLCATRNSNGIDYWLLAHEHGSDRFLTYSITSSGIELVDSTSIGVQHPNAVSGAIGQMKFSPDGERLVSTVSNTPTPGIEIFDFDNSSGEISSPLFFNPDTLEGFPMPFYGLSFSPDGNKLYASPIYWERVYQIDLLQSWSPSELVNGSILLNSIWNSSFGIHQIQLGPNGKVYLASRDASYLAVINNPDQVGIACDFNTQGISLLGNTSGWGLPSFIDSYDYTASGVCNPTGITESTLGSFSIHPNPASTSATLTLPVVGTYNIMVLDAMGRVVYQGLATTTSYELTTANWPHGIYAITATNKEGVRYTSKLVVGR